MFCVSVDTADYFAFNLVLVPQDAKLEYPTFDETWYLFHSKGKSHQQKNVQNLPFSPENVYGYELVYLDIFAADSSRVLIQ